MTISRPFHSDVVIGQTMDTSPPHRNSGSRLSVSDRSDLLGHYYTSNGNFTKAVKAFNEKHSGRISVSRRTLQELYKKFQDTGSVCNKPPSYRPRPATGTEASCTILDKVKQSPTSSIRHLAQECNTSVASVHRVLKRNGFHPYKEKRLQTLQPTDPVSRLQFCTWYLEHLETWNTLWTDEAIFHVDGSVFKRHFWDVENPRRFNACKTLHSPKVMVWAGIWGRRLIGPYFFDNNVTGNFLYMK